MVNLTQRLIVPLTAGLLALGVAGCATRPELLGNNIYSIKSDLELGQVDQSTSRYHVDGVKIFGEQFYYAVSPLGEALIKKEETARWDSFNVDEKGKVHGFTSIIPTNGGLYFIDHALDEKSRKKDFVKIDPTHKKAVIQNSPTIEEKGDWGIFCENEQDTKFDLGYGGRLIKPYFAVRVEDSKTKEKGFYPFYLVPVDKAGVRTSRKDGNIEIWNSNNIFRPKFHTWKQIDQEMLMLPLEQRKITEEILNQVGLKASKTGNVDNQ